MPKRIHVANPYDRDYSGGSNFLLWFGGHAPTLVLVYGSSLEGALELAAEAMAAEGYKGLVIPHNDPYIRELVAEAQDELGPIAQPWEAEEKATSELTYTESGYIDSYDWGIFKEDATKEDLIRIRRDRWPYH